MDPELDILIVEDVAGDADAIEAELRQDGLRCHTRRVETRDEFLAELTKAPPDLIISDFNLPTFDGLEALRLVQQIEPDIPFILVTGPRSEEVAVECMREGADDYILKNSLKRLPSAIANVLRKKAAEREKAWAEAQLRSLHRLIVEALETERRRVARDLHDSVNQVLSSVKFRLESIADRLQRQDETAWREALKAQYLLDKAIQEIVRISRNLRPSELDDLGLAPAIRSLCREFAERTGLGITPALDEVPAHCGKEIELALYRIVQEALNNIEKHARARHVLLRVTSEGPLLRTAIRDDGVGFDLSALPRRKTGPGGMGLIDMKERAAYVGGTCTVTSAPGQGTEILVTLPLQAEPEPRPRPREKKPAKKHQSPVGR